MIEIKNLCKTFTLEDENVEALKDVNITIADGKIFGIIGMSGAGKSTLVRCINMLERPTSGNVLIDGTDIGALNEKELRKVRRDVTMIFQGFNLLMQKTCLKNVCFPLELAGVNKEEAKKRAMELLEIVGLPDKANAYPAQLSGGQQQRIAIARALTTSPKVLLCDEATSALDPKTTHSILNLLKEINKKTGITIIVITHQMSVVEEICSEVAILDKGRVVEQGEVASIFANPHSEAAKRLVSPEGDNVVLSDNPDEICIRIVFNGASAAGKPMISQMAIDIGVAANILSASTKTIGGKVYGVMVLGISGGKDKAEAAKQYINSVPDVVAEEVRADV